MAAESDAPESGAVVSGTAAVRTAGGAGDPLEPVASRRAPRAGLWISIGRRVLWGFAILLAVSFLVYWATSALPGDVVTSILGPRSDPAAREALRQELGLDQPFLLSYAQWLGSILTGDLGTSFALKIPVAEFVGPRLLSTMILVTICALLTIPLAVAIGTLAATRPRGWFDNAVNIGSVALGAVPDFVVGLLLVMIFSTSLFHILPAVSISSPGWAVLENPVALVLPVATVLLAMSPYLVRVARSAVLEALQSEYVAAATLRGVPHRRVVFHHALRNALSPVVHASALLIGISLGGTAVVEFIFQYPGIGAGLVQAVNQRDLPTIQAIALIFAVVWIVTNLVADIIAMALSPRRRGGEV